MSDNKKEFIPVMLTPFNEDGSINYNELTQLVEFYITAGVAGLFANCLSSEMFQLVPEERLALTKHVVDIVDGRVPVVATSTFGGPIAEQGDFVKRMYDTGIDAAIIISNMLASEQESAAVFEERVFQLFDHTEQIPLGLYECPDPFKRIVQPEQLQRLVDTGRLIYHKDTCLDIDMVRDKLNLTKHVPNFGLYDAYMAHAVESLKAGARGLSCIQGNYFPELIVWLCDNYNREDKKDLVYELQDFFTRNMNLMHYAYPLTAKIMMGKYIKYFSTKVRGKELKLTNQELENLDQLWREHEVLLEKLS